jgi:hypothetical protein
LQMINLRKLRAQFQGSLECLGSLCMLTCFQ